MNVQKIMSECRVAADEAAKKKYGALVAAGPKYQVYAADLNGNRLPDAKVYTMLDNCGGAYLQIPGTGEFIREIKKAATSIQYGRYCGDGWSASKGVYKGYTLHIDHSLQIRQEHAIHVAAMQAAAKLLNENGVQAIVKDYID